LLRIGELSRRSGISPERLRAWERRYGLLHPTRSAGGLRLYSLDDLERVRTMRAHVESGLAAAEAAALATAAPREPAAPAVGTVLDATAARTELAAALERFDEPAAQAVVDRLLSLATLDTLLAQVVLPYLHDLGARWKAGDLSIAAEHFATNVLRGRLLGLARDWGRGDGRRALLACAPGEQHDLGLIAFGLALRARGWRIDFLGSDTPLPSIVEVARATQPELLVLSAVRPQRFRALGASLADLGRAHPVALAGEGARRFRPPDGTEVLLLTGDPVAEAERVSARRYPRPPGP
jgi:MerR family transcriptional regulator, light-induced transcriptional regulator